MTIVINISRPYLESLLNTVTFPLEMIGKFILCFISLPLVFSDLLPFPPGLTAEPSNCVVTYLELGSISLSISCNGFSEVSYYTNTAQTVTQFQSALMLSVQTMNGNMIGCVNPSGETWFILQCLFTLPHGTTLGPIDTSLDSRHISGASRM